MYTLFGGKGGLVLPTQDFTDEWIQSGNEHGNVFDRENVVLEMIRKVQRFGDTE